MTPVPLDLPLRPAEATELANLVFEHAERKPLTDELRNRLAARAAALKLETVTPYFGSLERDPVHPSAYYLAVDGRNSAQLLYLALATAPTSSIYHQPLLIGRMRRMAGPEMVISAIPFGPGDRDNVETFAARINAAFHPQPQGARSTITVEGDPAAAFVVFRALQRRTGKNLAAVAGDYHATLWAAIRAGWRAGYTVATDHLVQIYDAAYSRFCLTVPLTAEGLRAAEDRHEQIRRARWGLKVARAFDFALSFDSPLSAESLGASLEQLREGVHAPQLVGCTPADDLEEIAAVARQFQITLSFTYSGEPATTLQTVARATGGRFDYRVPSPAEAEFVAEHLL